MDFTSPINLSRFKPILLDANVLLGVAHSGEGFQEVDQLMRRWGRIKTSYGAFVTDFIVHEAISAEKQKYETKRVRYFLKEVEKSRDGFYIEVRTPIRKVMADKRGQYLNLLSKRDRHIILKGYPELSGTDISLLVVSVHMHSNGAEVTLASLDKKLVEAAETLNIATLKMF